MKNSKINLMILAAFVLVGTICWNSYFRNYYAQDTVDIAAFPQSIDDWTSTELPITEDEYAILETRNAFVRQYKNEKGEEVYLFIVYSQNNRKVSHPPELCYTGSGVSVSKRSIVSLSNPMAQSSENEFKANKIYLHKGKLNEIALYWFKVGESFTENYTKQQFLIAIKTLLRHPASSALIRVSTSIIDENEEAAIQLLKSFSHRILPELKTYLP